MKFRFPIVIIDEPQSVDNTPKAKEAIASLNPLCVLRYSATHREKINLLYRLTPVDAYQMGLVKQISVSSNQVSGGFVVIICAVVAATIGALLFPVHDAPTGKEADA